MALREAEAAGERHVADIGELQLAPRHHAVHVMIGADALDLTHRARPEPRAGRLVTPRSIGTPTSAISRPPKSASAGASSRAGASSNVATPS